MGRAGATISGTLVKQENSYLGLTQSSQSLNSKLPYSFVSALDKIEQEILALAAENTFCKKETFILKTEQDTIETVVKTQSADIERYLQKEVFILDDVISKQNLR
jgi:hypothetical protein